jgi:FKBP-type peptidyl-prolyl cis-trans isomerase
MFDYTNIQIKDTENMKKSIVSIILLLIVCAGVAVSQTRKTAVRRKTPVVKRVITRKKPVVVTVKSPDVTTASGLTYIITQKGTGAQLKVGDTVKVHYTGLLTSGVKFDSSLDRGDPIEFPLGKGRVIKGWDEGILKLRVGDRAILYIPPALAYGAKGAGNGAIPPDSTLIFIVEVVGVQ